VAVIISAAFISVQSLQPLGTLFGSLVFIAATGYLLLEVSWNRWVRLALFLGVAMACYWFDKSALVNRDQTAIVGLKVNDILNGHNDLRSGDVPKVEVDFRNYGPADADDLSLRASIRAYSTPKSSLDEEKLFDTFRDVEYHTALLVGDVRPSDRDQAPPSRIVQADILSKTDANELRDGTERLYVFARAEYRVGERNESAEWCGWLRPRGKWQRCARPH
jgi:hypothetical protein